MADSKAVLRLPGRGEFIDRHSLIVRVTHWINVLCVTVLLMSGLHIFNAWPRLHWGQVSGSSADALFEIGSRRDADGRLAGFTRIFGHEFVTTGVLGVSADTRGVMQSRAFPEWATLPGPYWLPMAREWHFFFAWLFVLNGLVYLLHTVCGHHLRRDLLPDRSDLAGLGRSFVDHLRLRHPTGTGALRYNPLQKLAYLVVIFMLLPLMTLAGWALSPWLDAVLPGWVNLLGGRQAARTLHFAMACLLCAFVLVHVFEVLASGVWNQLRSMLTGRYRLPGDDHDRRA